jgi:hypothetical protein
MKGKRMLFGVVMLCTVLIMAQASVSNAATYGGAWLPNDFEDAFFVELANPLGRDSYSFFMYNSENENASMEVFGPEITQTVYFTHIIKEEEETWYAGRTKGAATLNLGSDLEFGFFFKNDEKSIFEYDLRQSTSGDSYILSHGSMNIQVVTSDVAPVPLPASALLLGSGMVGLIAFGRVRLRGIFS